VTTFLLLRHAAHDNVGGFLAGRKSGVSLGEAGLAQAHRLAARLRDEPIAMVYCSPLERTRETATIVAQSRGLPAPVVVEELNEIDFGAWSGRDFDDLNRDPLWRAWNERRSLARTPSGERMVDVQARVLGAMAVMAQAHPDDVVAMVTHADVIKAAVMHHLGMDIDAWPRLEISPASISRLAIDAYGARLIGLNELVN
jgi:broad specificity phosphatase PhoE